MPAAEWIALITPGLAVAGGMYAAVVKLTRMAVAIEQLTSTLGLVHERVDVHEGRIAVLEERTSGRHARRG